MRKTIVFTFVISFIFSALVKGQGCAEASSDEGVNVMGFIQPQYDYKFDDEGTNSFNFNRARIGVVGNVPYDFSYYAIIDFSKFKPEAPYILDAFVTYTRFSFAKMSFGQMKNPFGLELNTACSGLHTINRSKVVNELTGPDRQLGFMVLGGSDTTLLSYSLAVMNGYTRGFKDENTAKDIIGRVRIKPLKFLTLGGSFWMGKTGVDMDNKKTRFGGELEIKHSNFLVQGEYIYGKDTGSYTTGGGCDGTPIEFHDGPVERSGFFVHAMYMTPWNLQPVLKFESYDSDMDLGNNSENITTFGMNYFFNDWTRLQVNYVYAAEQANEIKNDQLMVQMQIKF